MALEAPGGSGKNGALGHFRLELMHREALGWRRDPGPPQVISDDRWGWDPGRRQVRSDAPGRLWAGDETRGKAMLEVIPWEALDW